MLRRLCLLCCAVLVAPWTGRAQSSTVGPSRLTLAQAEQLALKNHPRAQSASLSADATGEMVAQARSAYLPGVNASVTAAAANDGTLLAAGALQTSALNTRFATGLTIVQLVTDFGRTSNLVRAAQFRYRAANNSVLNIRAQLLLGVRRAYFGVLGSESVLRAARATLDNRQLTLRQVSALAQSSLRSTLDLTFAQVQVSEAQLALDQADNAAHSSRAVLAAAMGLTDLQNSVLDDPQDITSLDPDISELVTDALRDRPDLQLLRQNHEAAEQFAKAEKKLSYPTVGLIATGGVIPEHDHTIPRNNYEAAGVNVTIPVFNGGLFAARRSEALLRAQAAEKDVEDLRLQIERDVRVAWYNANNSFRRLDVTRQLVEQSRKAVHLAKARYDSGLGSIVELNQAQVSQISAEINAAAAKYDYLSRYTELDFTIGALR